MQSQPVYNRSYAKIGLDRFLSVAELQKTDVDWSTSVLGGFLQSVDRGRPVAIPVHGPGGQKTRLDWTWKH